MTECGQGNRHWEWTRGRLALMLRTDRRWIPTEWLLRPQFRLWPPPRHRAVSWTLATFIEFRSQRGVLLTLSDLHYFFKRAKTKLYQSRNRMRLVGNYLDVLELWCPVTAEWFDGDTCERMTLCWALHLTQKCCPHNVHWHFWYRLTNWLYSLLSIHCL
jgi:hypothetical protein